MSVYIHIEKRYFILSGAPTGRLKEVISGEDVATIARDLLIKWEPLRPYLGLNRQQEEEICQSYPRNYRKQKQECLERWKELKGDEATYSALIKAAIKAKDQQLADRVKAIYSKSVEPKVLEQSKPLHLQHQKRKCNPLPRANINNQTHQGRGKVLCITESSLHSSSMYTPVTHTITHIHYKPLFSPCVTS